jgi:hypothetical protein
MRSGDEQLDGEKGDDQIGFDDFNELASWRVGELASW